MHLDLHYVDPRLVAMYDGDNPRGEDTEFYVALADELGASTILDLGCGTGVLTRALATPGRTVVGVDPAPAMLDWARRQPDAERVRWVEGDASALGEPGADLLVMTGNVAQVFLEDEAWDSALRHIRDALRPGGRVAFESRNPSDRAWERWNRAATYEVVQTAEGPVECWLDLLEPGPVRVRFAGHNRFPSGEDLVVTSTLRFRTREEIASSLERAGLAVEHIYGDWRRGPLAEASRVMVFVARRSDEGAR